MPYHTSFSLFITFLGGGLVGAAFNWIRLLSSEHKTLKATRIRLQLENLYGPLFFITSQAESLREISDRHSKAYRIEYIEEKLGNDEGSASAIEVNNQYARQLNELANQAVEIMRDGYSYIDPKDSEQFQYIVSDTVRREIEWDESGNLMTPLEIYWHVGNMYFFRTGFISLVKQRFNELSDELVKLES